MMPSLDTILDNFTFLEDWEDRYRYLIELGRSLEPLTDDEHNEGNRVEGCASQVWLVVSEEERQGMVYMRFRADSDAHLVRGLLTLVLSLYDNHTREEIKEIDAEDFFKKLNLSGHLSQQRSNGLRSVVEKIRSTAS